MVKPSKELTKLLAERVSRSGFPFQAKIEALVVTASDWSVVGSECSWLYQGEEGFLDIVASRKDLYLTIECKRVGKDSGEQRNKHQTKVFEGAPKKSYVFLCRENEIESQAQTNRAVITRFLDEIDIGDDPIRQVGIYAEERFFEPASHEVSFCVTVDIDKPDNMIERDISTLVRGTHGFATQWYSTLWTVGAGLNDVFLPVYVTTSPLFVLDCDPEQVSIDTGEFKFEPSRIRPVRWIRFRKSFMAEAESESMERTVLVVQAKYFSDLLNNLKPVDQRALPVPGNGTP